MPSTSGYLQVILEETPRYENAAATTPYRLATDIAYWPIQSARIVPQPAHIDRADEQRAIGGAVARLLDNYEPEGNITMRMYGNAICWMLEAAGYIGVHTAGGASVSGVQATTATGVNAINSATLNVGDTSNFPTSGSALLGGVSFTYTGVTATSFTGCGNHAATTGGEAVQDIAPTNTHKWVFDKRNGSGATGTVPLLAKTMQLIAAYYEAGVFLKGQGFGINQLTMNAEGIMSADMIGLVLKRISDPTLTASYDTQAIPPFRRADMSLSWLTGTGETDDFNLTIANAISRHKTFGQAQRSYFSDKMFMDDARVAVSGTIPKYGLDADDFDALMAASTFAAAAKWQSDKVIGATAYPYSMRLDMPSCQIVGGAQDDLGNKRRYGASFDWFAAWDETAGYDARFTVINNVASMETFV